MDQHAATGPPPPGYRADWYPDPTQRFEFRYHNGQAWTGDVSTNGHRFLDPLPSMPSMPSMPSGHGALPGTGGVDRPYGREESIAGSLAAFVLGICSIFVGWVPFLCVLSGVGAVVGLVLGTNALRRDRRRRREGGVNHRGHGYALTGVILAPIGLAVTGIGVWFTVLTLREVDQFTNVGAYDTAIVSCRVGDGRATATGTITNDSRRTRSYHVTIDFDRAGTSVRLGSGDVGVNDVAPGDTANWTVTAPVGANDVDCHVRDVTGPVPFGES